MNEENISQEAEQDINCTERPQDGRGQEKKEDWQSRSVGES